MSAAAILALAVSSCAHSGPREPSPLSAVAQSASGRALIADLEKACGPPPEVGFELFLARLEGQVSDLTGRLVDGSDQEFTDAAASLDRVPRRLRRDSLVTVIVLLDEWSARTSTLPLGQRALDVLKQHTWSKRGDLRYRQIDERFPFLAPIAREVLGSVGVQTPRTERRNTVEPASAPSPRSESSGDLPRAQSTRGRWYG